MTSTTSTNDAALLAFAFAVSVALAIYLSPTITAGVRKVPNVGSVLAINLLLGWTLAGWAVAWAMALRSRPRPTAATHVAAVAGWYPDPLVPSRLRYWTGAGWSPAVHDMTNPPR